MSKWCISTAAQYSKLMCPHMIAFAIWWTLTKAYQVAGPGYSSQVYKVRTFTIPPLELDLFSLMRVEHLWSSEWKESNHGWAMCLCPFFFFFAFALLRRDWLILISWGLHDGSEAEKNVSRQGHFFLWLKQLFLWKNSDSENRREDNKNSYVRKKPSWLHLLYTYRDTWKDLAGSRVSERL